MVGSPPQRLVKKLPSRAPARLAARTAPRTPHGLRIGAVDVGSNSMHMVIVEITDRLDFRVLASEKEITQLGSSALVRHRLTRQAMNHTYRVLERYQQIARRLDCDVLLAYATSAVRECANGPDFCALLKLDLGLDIQIISSQEEARLVYLAVRQAIELTTPEGKPSLIVDIGGGSAEFIVGNSEKPVLLQSRKLGASRLTQQFLTADPPRHKQISRLEKHIAQATEQILPLIRASGVTRVIGTSGTMENLVAMCLLQHGEENVRHRVLTEMTREDFDLVYQRLLDLPLAERKKLPGLDPDRADQIAAGAVLVNFLFKRLKIDRIEVCDRAMREGMIIDYMQKHWPKVRLSVQIRDPRRRSVIELGRRCNYDEAHALHVAELAGSMFDQLAQLHGLGPAQRQLLEYAAMLHDIGWHIGRSGHHKHSAYLIRNGELEGFSHNEIEVIANTARYHRRSAPKKSHAEFMALPLDLRQTVTKLAAILRIADGLDRGHYGTVKKIRVVRRDSGGGHAISLRLQTQSDPQLELWGARHKTDLFEDTYHVRVSLSAKVVSA